MRKQAEKLKNNDFFLSAQLHFTSGKTEVSSPWKRRYERKKRYETLQTKRSISSILSSVKQCPVWILKHLQLVGWSQTSFHKRFRLLESEGASCKKQYLGGYD